MTEYHKPSTREVLVRKLQAMGDQGYMFERAILRSMPSGRRTQVLDELAQLLSGGYIVRFGTGRRGDPHRIALSGTWPFNKCPLCGHIEHPAPSELVTAEFTEAYLNAHDVLYFPETP